jgi:DNA repair exonuclease SbcCD ATPase subunit
MARPVAFTAVFIVIVLSTAVAHLPAQQTTSTQTEVLAEVRLLRQAIESLAGTNARVQIVFGRLTLQEQRTANAAKRLDEARAALAKITQDVAQLGDHLKDLDEAQSDSRRKPEELEQVRMESVAIKRQLDRMEIERARLAADEADAAGALNQEQGRWSDLNRQLEDLERALSKR